MHSERTVLFLVLPFRSHYLASFNYARYLKGRGHRIVYAGVASLREFVQQQSFDFHAIEYLFEYKINSMRAFLAFFLLSFFDKTFKRKNFRQFHFAYLECKRLMDRYDPGSVYIDEGFSEYYWFFKEYDREIKFINSSLSTAKVHGIPPLHSAFRPRYTWWSDVVCEMLWFFNLIRLKAREWIYSIAFLGYDEIYFWKRFCKSHGWNWRANMTWNHAFYRCVKNVETIILSPRILEYKNRMPIGHEFYFHQRIVRNEECYFTRPYLDVIERIESMRVLNLNQKVIYCTFGTQSALNRKNQTAFILKLAACIENRPDLFLVVSHDDQSLQSLSSERVHILPFVPNLHFYQYTHLVISHGGLGTIKECVDASVPMIIYPSNRKSDNLSNANRIVHLGFGLAGSFRTATPASIGKKIDRILRHAHYYDAAVPATGRVMVENYNV